ncbi:unnamed protein product [Paramecium sonneborni]|uniref:Uncharacterized protein n=1 Tax=Paramecium sonneborni TaxID=65129 RepID=A0A8S1PA08_9CILI|nr:unnamed protein product [Paramecium sonneborni]
MSSEINIRQLLYYKSLNPSPTQQSLRTVKTTQHRLNKLRSTAYSDFRLTTLQTQTPINNFRYGFNVDEYENYNSQIHFLEVYEHPIKYINPNQVINQIEYAQRFLLLIKKSLNQKYKLLKHDNVQFIEEQYKLSKEYQRLAKVKQLMEEKNQQLLSRVVQLENTLQGVTLELQQ